MHMDLIGPYNKSIRQQHTFGAIIKNIFSLTWMTMIDPDTDWFRIFEILTYDLNEVTDSNDDYK